MGKPIASTGQLPFNIGGYCVSGANINDELIVGGLNIYKQRSFNIYDLIDKNGKIYKYIELVTKKSNGEPLRFERPASESVELISKNTFFIKIDKTKTDKTGFVSLFQSRKIKLDTGEYLFKPFPLTVCGNENLADKFINVEWSIYTTDLDEYYSELNEHKALKQGGKIAITLKFTPSNFVPLTPVNFEWDAGADVDFLGTEDNLTYYFKVNKTNEYGSHVDFVIEDGFDYDSEFRQDNRGSILMVCLNGEYAKSFGFIGDYNIKGHRVDWEPGLLVGESIKLKLITTSIDGSSFRTLPPYDEFVWTTSDPNICTVDDGLLTAKKVGGVVISGYFKNNPEITIDREFNLLCRDDVPTKVLTYIPKSGIQPIGETVIYECKSLPESLNYEFSILNYSSGDAGVDGGQVKKTGNVRFNDKSTTHTDSFLQSTAEGAFPLSINITKRVRPSKFSYQVPEYIVIGRPETQNEYCYVGETTGITAYVRYTTYFGSLDNYFEYDVAFEDPSMVEFLPEPYFIEGRFDTDINTKYFKVLKSGDIKIKMVLKEDPTIYGTFVIHALIPPNMNKF